MRGSRGVDLPFNVSIRVDAATLEKLQFMKMYEGHSYGEICRQAVEDYLSGVTAGESDAMAAYRVWTALRARGKRQSMAGFIATVKASQKLPDVAEG